VTVTFFGHKDIPQEIQPSLEATLIDLIANRAADIFYVGNQGKFDSMVKSTLQKLKKSYSNISYTVVLAYMPTKQENFYQTDFSNTIYPDGIEKSPLKFAICWRNKWMVNHSDYVITYVTRSFGGAAKFSDYAIRQGKTVINLAEKKT